MARYPRLENTASRYLIRQFACLRDKLRLYKTKTNGVTLPTDWIRLR
jgi:hypothetical protein